MLVLCQLNFYVMEKDTHACKFFCLVETIGRKLESVVSLDMPPFNPRVDSLL